MEIQALDQDASNFKFIKKSSKYQNKVYKINLTTDVPKEQYQDWYHKHLKKKRVSKKPQYFQNIIKEQHKKMYVANFIKKLKRTIVPRQQVYHQSLKIHQIQEEKGLRGYKMSLNQECIYSMFVLITNFILTIFITLSLAFQKIQQSSFNIWMGVSLLFHIIQILKQTLCTKVEFAQQIKKLNNIFSIYIQKQFLFDAIILLVLILQLFLSMNSITSQILRVFILFKLKNFKKHLKNLQFNLIDNIYNQQIWSLVKMLILNFVFAHFSCIILILMTKLNPSQNWITQHHLQNVSYQQLYVWSYYWAVTIMISLGFGDFTPIVWQQTMCIIFIQIFSCMFFAYNINSIGDIIKKIRSYDQEAYSNMKIFNNYVKKTSLSDQLKNRLRNYIKQSVTIKKELNISQEKMFLNRLPETFKKEVLKQSNENIWKNLLFFKNLSQKMICLLSTQIQKHISHPEQIIYKKSSPLNIFIFQSGAYSFLYSRPLNFKNLTSNGKQIHNFILTKQNGYNILSLDFLFQKQGLNFDVKSNDYTILYKLSNQEFINCLKHNPYDFQYFCMTRDKDAILMNQFEFHQCQLCPKQKHYLFKCPKLHYIPLNQHIIRKHLSSLNYKYKSIIENIRKERKYYKTLKDLKVYKQSINKYKIFPLFQGQTILLSTLKKPIREIEGSQSDLLKLETLVSNLNMENQINEKLRLKQEIQQIYEKIKQKQTFLWEIDSDVVHNFKYYFKKWNSEHLNFKNTNKKKR